MVLDGLLLVSSLMAVAASNYVLHRRLKGLKGHRKLIHFTALVSSIGLLVYAAYVFGLFSLLVGSLAAAGALGLVIGFALMPWIADALVGITLYLDPMVSEGAEVEIAGKRGVIVEMSLTRTKILGEGGEVMVVPNRKFREEIFSVRVRELRQRSLDLL